MREKKREKDGQCGVRKNGRISTFFFSKFLESFKEHKWWGKKLKLIENNKEWLDKSQIGRLRDLSMFDQLEDVFMLQGEGEVKLNYVGDDTAMIRGITKEAITTICKEETK